MPYIEIFVTGEVYNELAKKGVQEKKTTREKIQDIVNEWVKLNVSQS